MILHGKAKEEFLKQFCEVLPINEIELNAHIIEWFDSVGIYIEVGGIDHHGLIHYWYNIQQHDTINGMNGHIFVTRSEATNEAIKKAVEIFNKL